MVLATGVGVHQTALYDMLLAGLVFVFLWWFIRSPRREGVVTLTFGLAYGCIRLLEDSVRIEKGEVKVEYKTFDPKNLPNGTFTPYSAGTKTNVVFFTKGYPTERVWIYDATHFPRCRRVAFAIVDADPALGAPLVPGLPYRRAEAVYAVRYEMATTLADVLVGDNVIWRNNSSKTHNVKAETAGYNSGRFARERPLVGVETLHVCREGQRLDVEHELHVLGDAPTVDVHDLRTAELTEAQSEVERRSRHDHQVGFLECFGPCPREGEAMVCRDATTPLPVHKDRYLRLLDES